MGDSLDRLLQYLTQIGIFLLFLVGSASYGGVALGPIVAATTAIPVSIVGSASAKQALDGRNGVGSTEANSSEEVDSEGSLASFKELDVWERIRAGFQLDDLLGPLVEKHEQWYADRPDYMARMMERSRLYLFHIVEEIERRHMPLEIALLPMIESAFNPKANSTAHASGLWQFIPETGKRYGMPQNWWQDKRYDVLAATNGALDYLQVLFEQFGDWHLALAAYNWGEGAVSRAINRNRAKGLPTDYASLNMPLETRNYLPKLQAVKNIIKNPTGWGIVLATIPNQPYFLPVTVDRPLDLKKAAELAGLSVDDFTALNPAYKRPVLGGEAQLTILVPAEQAYVFAHQLDNYEEGLISWGPYQLKPGETLENLAKRYHIELAALRRANGLDGVRRVPVGHTLLVPATPQADNEESVVAAIKHAAFSIIANPVASGSSWHRVKKGESLHSIAAFHKVSKDALKGWNKLPTGQVYVGQRLRITEKPAAAVTGRRKNPTQKVGTAKRQHAAVAKFAVARTKKRK